MEILEDEQDEQSFMKEEEDSGSENDIPEANSDVNSDDVDEEIPEQECSLTDRSIKDECHDEQQHQSEIQQMLEMPVDEQKEQRKQHPPNRV